MKRLLTKKTQLMLNLPFTIYRMNGGKSRIPVHQYGRQMIIKPDQMVGADGLEPPTLSV